MSNTVILPGSKWAISETQRPMRLKETGEEIFPVTFGYVKDESFPYHLPLTEHMRKSTFENVKTGKYLIDFDVSKMVFFLKDKETKEEIPR